MEFKMEKGVTIPPPKRVSAHNKGWRKYPFESMEKDTSVFIPREFAVQAKVQNAVFRSSQRTGWKFVTRTVEGGVRVWRTE